MKTPILFSIAKDLCTSRSISDEVIESIKAVSDTKDPETVEDINALVLNIITPFKFESSLKFRDVLSNASASFIKAKHYSDFSTEDFV